MLRFHPRIAAAVSLVLLTILVTGCEQGSSKDKKPDAAASGTAERGRGSGSRATPAILADPIQEETKPAEGAKTAGENKPATEEKPAAEARVLFDGTNLDQFRGYAEEKIGAGWKVEEGVLRFDGSGGGDICTRDEFSDFELTFDWKVTKGANSGVMYRVSLGDSAPYLSGPEFQILDDAEHPDGKNESTSAGSLYALYAPANKSLKPVGEWNTAKIVIKGNRVEHWLNEQMVVEAELDSEDWKNRVAASKFKDWEKFGKNPSGHICFQDHGNEVWYRNIRIRDLSGETGAK